jgi:hypothetical protein
MLHSQSFESDLLILSNNKTRVQTNNLKKVHHQKFPLLEPILCRTIHSPQGKKNRTANGGLVIQEKLLFFSLSFSEGSERASFDS